LYSICDADPGPLVGTVKKDKMRSNVYTVQYFREKQHCGDRGKEVVFGEIVQRIVPRMPIIYIVLGWEITYYNI
jgi:hypothetical protein